MKTHKIINLFCFLLLITDMAFSQENKFQVLSETKFLGKNYLNGADIVGAELKFPDKIHDYFVDTVNHFLTVQLRGVKNSGKYKKNGNILQYNIQTNEILWTKPINYEICEFLKFDTLMVFNDYNVSYGIDAHTGNNIWKVLNYIYSANPQYNIGIAYQYLAGNGYTNELMGIGLQQKSKLIWKRNINRTFGWNDFFYLNDSTLMVVAAGLHSINIHTGTGWDYNTLTGVDGISGTNMAGAVAGAVAVGVVGAVLGALTGVFIIPIPTSGTSDEKNIIRDVASNTLINNGFIYFASKEKLVKIDKETGNIIWESVFQKDLSSKSSIFMVDDVIYMINYGFAYKGNNRIYYGKPFLAAFDIQTGKYKYSSLHDHARGYIVDYKQIDNDIYLLFQNKIAKYNLTTGTKLSEKIFSDGTYGELQYFADDNVFVLEKNEYLNLAQYEPLNFHIHSQRTILSIDEELNVTNTIRYSRIGNCILNYGDYQFITNDKKTFIVNSKNQIIAELEITSKFFIIDDILYDKRNNSFIAIDLRNIGF